MGSEVPGLRRGSNERHHRVFRLVLRGCCSFRGFIRGPEHPYGTEGHEWNPLRRVESVDIVDFACAMLSGMPEHR